MAFSAGWKSFEFLKDFPRLKNSVSWTELSLYYTHRRVSKKDSACRQWIGESYGLTKTSRRRSKVYPLQRRRRGSQRSLKRDRRSRTDGRCSDLGAHQPPASIDSASRDE